MKLRDLVQTFFALDDQLREVGTQIDHRGDRLARTALSATWGALASRNIRTLAVRMAQSADDPEALDRLTEELRDRILEAACARAPGGPGNGDGGAEAVAQAEAHARPALEDVERLRALLARRSELTRELEGMRRGVGQPEALELVEAIVRARRAAPDSPARDTDGVLVAAEEAARDDASLEAVAEDVRALRAALEQDGPVDELGARLGERVLQAARTTTRAREELEGRLEQLARRTQRREEISRHLVQSSARASEILALVGSLERELTADGLRDGALGPLKAACIEHGVVTLLLTLRRLRVDREALGQAVARLTAVLGDLFATIARHPELVRRLTRVWHDLAFADAQAIEEAWEEAYSKVLAVRKDPGGMLSVSPDLLARLCGADGFNPWLDQLISVVDRNLDELVLLVDGLEAVDRVLTDVFEMGESPAVVVRVKRNLALFVGEVSHAVHGYYGRVRDTLIAPEAGFRRLQDGVAGFAHCEALSSEASDEERHASFAATLAEVASFFSQLESELPVSGQGSSWERMERGAREQAASIHEELAMLAARASRWRELVLPPLPAACENAFRLAERLRREPAQTIEELGAHGSAADGLIGALQSLHLERLFHECLDLSREGEGANVVRMAKSRDQRLLDLHGASLTLLLRLLMLLGAEHERLSETERAEHRAWLKEWRAHTLAELRSHVERLDHCLGDLPDVGERHAHFRIAFDAYHAWAREVLDSDAGTEQFERETRGMLEEFEAELGRVGKGLLDKPRPGGLQGSAELEQLFELYGHIVAELGDRRTLTDLRAQFAQRRELCGLLRVAMSGAAEPEDASVLLRVSRSGVMSGASMADRVLLLFRRGSQFIAASEAGPEGMTHLTVVLALRVLVLVGAAARGILHLDWYLSHPARLAAELAALAGFALHVTVLSWLRTARPLLFLSERCQLAQLVLDVLFIATLYFLTGEAQSDFFLFFAVPLLLPTTMDLRWRSLPSPLLAGSALLALVVAMPRFYAEESSGLLGDVLRVYAPRMAALLGVALLIDLVVEYGRFVRAERKERHEFLELLDRVRRQAILEGGGPAATAAASGVAEGLRPGRTVGGRYRVFASLGGGTAGHTFQAMDLELQDMVALKALAVPASVDVDEALPGLRAEVDAMRRIEHPNVARVLDLGETHGQPFLSEEYVPGATLRELVGQWGSLAIGPGLRIFKQACRGLEAIHEAGLVHGDLTPAHVMILPHGLVKLTGLGSGRLFRRLHAEEAAAIDVRSPFYRSPEELAGREVDARSDLYSLGILMFKTFTGTHPFAADSPQAVADLQLAEAAPRPSEHGAGLPASLERIILDCLAKEPAQRPPSADAVQAALLGVTLERWGTTPEPVRVRPPWSAPGRARDQDVPAPTRHVPRSLPKRTSS